MTIPFLILVVVACLVALQNWRYGIAAMILVSVVQDPLRKLTDGVPSYFMLGAAMVFVAITISLLSRNKLSSINTLFMGDKNIKYVAQALIAILVVQGVHSLLRWHSPILLIFGYMQYLLPVVALLVGLAIFKTERSVKYFMTIYLVFTIPACATVYLSEYYGELYPILLEVGAAVGAELVIYDIGSALKSYSGIYRVGEIAAWHAAISITFLAILSARNPSLAVRAVAGLLIIMLIGAILLTGRRKMLMALTIFLTCQGALMVYYHKGIGKIVFTSLILGVIGSMALTFMEPGSIKSKYYERGVSVFESVDERAGTSIDLFRSAISRSSGLGLGVGVASQGSQYAGGASVNVGGAGEAGLGKIVLELGLLGAIIFFLLLLLFAKKIFHSLRVLSLVNADLLFYAVSIISILVANMITFMVATQLFGDLFVLIMIGLMFGALISILRTGIGMYALREKYNLFVKNRIYTATY